MKSMGVEVIPEAVETGQKNASPNGITTLTMFVIQQKIGGKLPKEGIQPLPSGRPTTQGLDRKFIKANQTGADRVLPISPVMSQTMARDIKLYQELGYELKKVNWLTCFQTQSTWSV